MATTTIGHRAEVTVARVLERALGPSRAAPMLEKILPDARSTRFDHLKWMETAALVKLLADENPQTIALTLTFLSSEKAGAVLQGFDPAVQDEVVYRIAMMQTVSAEALSDLEILLSRNIDVSAAAVTHTGGITDAAAIMNAVGKTDEARIMKELQRRDKDLARAIREEMFVFADLFALDDKTLGTVLRGVENAALILAIKGASPEQAQRMLGCMSNRAAQSIQDEISEMGPVKVEDVIAAQKQVVNAARNLADAGSIMLGGKGGEFV
jgi:flagellar motor switch protein FliG